MSVCLSVYKYLKMNSHPMQVIHKALCLRNVNPRAATARTFFASSTDRTTLLNTAEVRS